MKGTLRIYPDYSQDERKLKGYFDNMTAGLPVAPERGLLPFCFASNVIAGNVTYFGIEYMGADLETITSYAFDSALIVKTSLGSGRYSYEYKALTDVMTAITEFQSGVYRYKFTIGTTDMYSSIFEINDFKYLEEVGAGDFNDDFSDDFYI